MLLLLLLTLAGAYGAHDAFPKRVRNALESCCAHNGGCDALDCRLYREFRHSYRYDSLEAQCREPLLYAMWPPHRTQSVRFDCLAPEHFLARLQHDIRTSEAQTTLDTKEVQFLCIVDPRAIAHPQFKDMERVLPNGSRVHEPCATTYLRGTDADLLWRYLRAAAAPAAFSEIHVRAPRTYSGVRAPCADGNRSLLTLNAAESVRRLLPELGRRQRSTLRVLAHVYGVDARAHCVICDYRDGAPRVKMKKFETSVSVYPYHRRVTEPQRRAPPWARRDRLLARDSLWCAGYRALLALHRPQIMLENGVCYQPRRARRCHVLALGGARVIKMVLGDAAALAKARLPAYALHVRLRWASSPARWKPESVSVVRVGASLGSRRRLALARWLPRRRAYYAHDITLRAPDGHYLTIDTLGIEYFEDGTPERFSRSIDGKLDTDGDLKEVDWAETGVVEPDDWHPYPIQRQYNEQSTPTRSTLSRTANREKSSKESSDVSGSSTYKANVDKSSMCAITEENKSPSETIDLNKSSILNRNVFATLINDITDLQRTDVDIPTVQSNIDKSNTLPNVHKSSMRTAIAEKLMYVYKLSEQTTSISPEITNADPSSTQSEVNKFIQIISPVTTCVQVLNTGRTKVPVFSTSLTRVFGYLNMSNVDLTGGGTTNSTSGKPDKRPWRIGLTIAGIVLVVLLAGVCAVCLARYGWCPYCGKKKGKELQGAGPAAAAVAGATQSEAAEGGPLDVVVQSLIVAQGVTIALAARMLWHLWNTSRGPATGVTIGAGVKVP